MARGHRCPFGGDEFVVILKRIEKPKDGAKLAHKILDAFNESIVTEGHELLVTLSIGISQYPVDGREAHAGQKW